MRSVGYVALVAQRAYGFRRPSLPTVAALAVTATITALGITGYAWLTRDSESSVSSTPLPDVLPTQTPSPTVIADGSSQPVADPIYPDYGNPSIDVVNYHLALTWSPTQRVLTGSTTILLRAVTTISEIALDFSDVYTIDQATIDSRPAMATERDGADLALSSGEAIAAESTVTVVVDYHGTPRADPFPGTRTDVGTVGASVDDDGSLAAFQEPYGAYTWFPCSDQPSDKALFDLDITVPQGWAGVSSGTLTEVSALADGSSVFRWRGAQPSATYVLALAIDRYRRIDDTGPHDLPLTYWVNDDQSDEIISLLHKTPDIIAWLETRLGEYPFESCGVVIVPGQSAMETQTMVSFGAIDGEYGEQVLAHELAHQWFGDAVTPATWRDLWLNEGFATYVEKLYAVDQLGEDQTTLVEKMYDTDQTLRSEYGPPGNYDPDSFASSNVYVGPALMLHQLRCELGDSVFFAALHDWAQHHLYMTVNRSIFTQWLANYTGKSMAFAIDPWLDSTTTPSIPR